MQAGSCEGDSLLDCLIRWDDAPHQGVKCENSTEVGDVRDDCAGQGVSDGGRGVDGRGEH